MNTDILVNENHAHTNRCWWNFEEARWVCGPAATPETDRPLVDVRDMIVVHTAMLREFRLAPAAVTAVAPGGVKRAAVVDRHLGFLCDLLHHHHEGEDTLLWPAMRERVSPTALRILDEIEAQHGDIDAALQAVTDLRGAWTRDPSASHRDALAGHLGRLHLLLRAHLELEERAALPLAAAVLTESEWNAVGEAAVASMPKLALMLTFGMFAYEGDPAVLRSMLSSAPPVPRALLPKIAPRVYARRARLVHGTSRP